MALRLEDYFFLDSESFLFTFFVVDVKKARSNKISSAIFLKVSTKNHGIKFLPFFSLKKAVKAILSKSQYPAIHVHQPHTFSLIIDQKRGPKFSK